jgi:hypothetical protein
LIEKESNKQAYDHFKIYQAEIEHEGTSEGQHIVAGGGRQEEFKIIHTQIL